jgi:hypothetical protein
MPLPDTSTGLYWSIRGEVACMKHAPTDDRWSREGWKKIPKHYRNRFQCQHCAPDHAAIVDSRTTPQSETRTTPQSET